MEATAPEPVRYCLYTRKSSKQGLGQASTSAEVAHDPASFAFAQSGFRVPAVCSKNCLALFAARQGLEPQLTDPESVVLPLDDRANT